MSILNPFRKARPATGPVELTLDGPLAQKHRVHVVGDGPDVLVFSHGLGTDQTVWHPVLEGLPERYRAVLLDLPGAGPLLPEDFDPPPMTGSTALPRICWRCSRRWGSPAAAMSAIRSPA
jgi:pimeloyl-ACP methyl ester carboxylesterase